MHPQNHGFPSVKRKELIAWALFDFANSGYTTVVMTTIYSAYFVGVIASHHNASGLATLLWSLTIGMANFVVMLIGPVIGAIADHRASKKQFLLITSLGCIFATAMLSIANPGDVKIAMFLVSISAIMFALGENLIAAFLPEIVPKENMGRMSGYGWSVGYFGGLLTLGSCLWYIHWGTQQRMVETQIIPVTLLITATIFTVTACPTFLWLKERALPNPTDAHSRYSYFVISFQRLKNTFKQAQHFQDLFRFLLTLAIYQSGVSTVVVLAAIYAQEVMSFDQQQLIILIMVVNITAAIGAFICGHLQDRIGAVPTLSMTLILWIIAIIIAYFASLPIHMWIAGNLIGLAMGASQSVGRALVSQFTPQERSGEFLGLWGLVNRLSVIIGPLSYGLVNYLTHGNHRQAILSTLLFFIFGLILLFRVNEKRGRTAADIHY